jgi:hypothetical protein
MSDAEKMLVLIMALALLAFFVVVAWIIWRLFSKSKGLSGGMESDFSILDRLTEEEARMVRDAMVRQTMQRDNSVHKPGTTLADLERIAAVGPDAVASPVAMPPRPGGRSSRPMGMPAVAKPAVPAPVQTPETEGLPTIAFSTVPPWELDDLSGEATLILDPNRPGEASGASPQKRSEISGSQSGGSIDLEVLYRKGLIPREDYERLRALAEQAKDE